MRVLVTGAAGFYGWTMVQRLLKKPEIEKVIGVDNFSRTFFDRIKPELLGENTARFEMHKMDYAKLDAHILNNFDLDAIIHFAAFVSIDESMLIPNEYFLNNEIGTFNFSQSILKTKKQPQLIFASSPEVYGNPRYTPIDENHPLNPRSTYAATKVACEKHCMSMYEWYGYPVTAMRNFNTYGPNQNIWGHGAVLPTFINRALHSEPLRIEGDGTQTRDFMFIEDAVAAYEMALDNPKKAKGEIFNIGTGVQTSVKDLAQKVLTATNSKSTIEFVPGRKGDLFALAADTKKIHEKLGWQPTTPFETGLKKTVEWYKQYQK
ncbi:MAG: GDP-mannose 4,6-dehydratase [Candidatus Iainarchaeum archaeon]|uniref:GDP-mannose 4,6-dehydratase n=1 Tax=Candidatus Iainarchaeum sp. TaxID=3101447 RepID=A0A7T9I2V6_9ARCH|nr:MAG: GDP-mannose 4,6-dehydratase [Candidatus Diapherotrites archaeon]